MLLDATFLGFMQLLVYAGAIMVLYLFVIMLINPRDDSLPEEGGFTEKTFAVGVALLVFSLLAFGISNSETVSTLAEAGTIPDLPEVAQTHGAIEAFGYELFHKHLLVFEVASILILVGIIGAVHIAMKNKPAPVELGANETSRLSFLFLSAASASLKCPSEGSAAPPGGVVAAELGDRKGSQAIIGNLH